MLFCLKILNLNLKIEVQLESGYNIPSQSSICFGSGNELSRSIDICPQQSGQVKKCSSMR
jgi:hypothetical protein